MAYRQIFSALGIHAVALDMRGHGFTRLPTDIAALDSFHIFADDVVEFFNRYVKAPVVLAGHSFGGVAGILAAPQLTGQINGYVGFDPVSLTWLARTALSSRIGRNYAKRRFSLARNAARRKAVFTSPDEAFERYQNRGAFRGVPDQILRDYLAGGLELREDGAYHLCCPPLWEQAVFVAQNHNLYKAAPALPDNSHIIYAGKFSNVSTPATRSLVQKKQPKIQVTYDKDIAHLFPLQNPELAVQALKQTLTKAALG